MAIIMKIIIIIMKIIDHLFTVGQLLVTNGSYSRQD